ncbi:serine hydrolase domain-containing protein [Streptomyces sp. 796.1]|uniref:serine hydrolase domain-containing protein n=1 Tax=Streptomyces sp. 796.1 TaxID=3163029 RepID=UPI0039C9E8A7
MHDEPQARPEPSAAAPAPESAPAPVPVRAAASRTPTARRRLWLAGGAVAALVATVGTAGASGSAAAAGGGSPATAGRQHAGHDLQRDTDAIRDAGVTGVQVRTTGPDGRQQTATSGVSDLRTGRPVAPNGYFRTGSTDKALIATVMLKLATEGRLSLDDSVGRWLPGLLSGEGYDENAITLRHLLQHTSGIGDSGYPPMETRDEYYANRFHPRTAEQLVAAAMKEPPLFAPGRGWSYANTGFVVLSMVIERVTGNPWPEEIERRVIKPLGLRHTRFPDGPRLPRPHAKGYTMFAGTEGPVDTTLLDDADASGGHLSTTADLTTFVRALFDGRLLTAAERRELTRSVAVSEQVTKIWPGARYGLGLFSRPTACGERVWIPSGDMIGYRTRTGVSEDGRRSVVVSMSTQRLDSLVESKRQEDASTALIDDVLCPAGQGPKGSPSRG